MYKLAVIPGDGIGEEIVREGMKVLEALAKMEGFTYEAEHFPFGADHYLATGEILSEGFLEHVQTLDAVLLGAIGDPRCEEGMLERGIVGALRWELDMYVNLRPIKLYAEHLCPLKGVSRDSLDILVVRENTEGVYLGVGGNMKKGTKDEIAIQDMIYTYKGVERIIRYAFEATRKRNKKKKLTLCDKANAVRAHDLYRRVFAEMGKEYPDIEQDCAYVDATTMWMVKNPDYFDVIVTTNMFGDIITDLGAMLQGGLGIAAGGNIHPGRISCFEPIHGSAPKYKGKNVANPLATINAVGMMLEFLGEQSAAEKIDLAVTNLLESRRVPDLSARSGLTTDQIGDMMVEELSGADAKVS